MNHLYALGAIAFFAAGCYPSPPPPGTVRLRLQEGTPGVSPYAGSFRERIRVEYGGPRSRLAWGYEKWIDGKPSAPTKWESNSLGQTRVELLLELQETRSAQYDPGYPLHGKFTRPGDWGGGTSLGASPPLTIPPLAFAASYAQAPGYLEIPDGQETVVGAVFKHREKIDFPEGATPEQVAARVDWAILFRVKLTP